MGTGKHYIFGRDSLMILRKQAELLLSDKNNRSEGLSLSENEIRELFHEVQVQQVELDMQNDELKIANEELEMQRAKFANLFDLAPVGYFILNDLGIIEEVNTTGVNLLAAGKNQILNRRFQIFISPAEGEQFYAFLRKMLISGSKHRCTLKMLTDRGEMFHARIEGTATTSKETRRAMYYLAIIDISELVNTQQHLLTAKERLELALSASATGTWEILPETRNILLDDSSCRINGLDTEEFDGLYESFFRHIHSGDRQRVEESLNEALQNHTELDIDYRVIQNNKQIKYVSARGLNVQREDGSRSFIGILSDITDKKKLEKKANTLKLNQQKKITSAILKTEEKERKRISDSLHDGISQLLYGIRLQLQQYNKTEPVETLTTNINQLLDVLIKETRNISFELAPSILNDFGIKVAIEEMAARLSSSTLKISTQITDLHQRLNIETELSIFRIVQELINNSIKHADPRHISIVIKDSGKYVLIKVSDDGSGFDTDEKKIFLKGSGIANIKNRLTLYHGSFSIQSKPGKGTTVTIKTEKEASY